MNKTELIAELRRSACEDADPFFCGIEAFEAAISYRNIVGEALSNLSIPDLRTFYLLVARALERP